MLSDRDGSGLELGDVTVDKGSSAAVASIASGRGILCRPSHTTDGISAIASSGVPQNLSTLFTVVLSLRLRGWN